jgi:hypothetical protein
LDFPGSDIGARFNAAAASLCPTVSHPITYPYGSGTTITSSINYLGEDFTAGNIIVPPGVYQFTTNIVFPCPVTIDGPGAVLRFNGSGVMLTFGTDGLTPSIRHDGLYKISNITFTTAGSSGSNTVSYGLFLKSYITNVRTERLHWWDFGYSTAAETSTIAEHAAMQVWNLRSEADEFTGIHWGHFGSWLDIYEDANDMVKVNNALVAHGGGYGIQLNGYNSSVTNSNIAAMGGGEILIDREAQHAVIHNNYLEDWDNNGCIGYGKATSDTGFLVGLEITGNYCNPHGVDANKNSSGLMYPRNSSTGIQNSVISSNSIDSMCAAAQVGGGAAGSCSADNAFIVKQTAAAGQVSNVAFGNTINVGSITVAPVNLHSNVGTLWYGSDGDNVIAHGLNGNLISSAYGDVLSFTYPGTNYISAASTGGRLVFETSGGAIAFVLDDSQNTTTFGNLSVKLGSTVVYRCTTAGTLRVGQLTAVSADCGTVVDTGLRFN